jgi:hypothetical protein
MLLGMRPREVHARGHASPAGRAIYTCNAVTPASVRNTGYQTGIRQAETDRRTSM